MFPGVLALMHCAFSREVSGKWYYIEVRTHYECKQEQVLLVVLVVVPVVVVVVVVAALRVD